MGGGIGCLFELLGMSMFEMSFLEITWGAVLGHGSYSLTFSEVNLAPELTELIAY